MLAALCVFGRALCAPPALGNDFVAPAAEVAGFGAPGAVFATAPEGFTAVFFAGLEVGPSEDIDLLIPSP